MNHPIAEIFSQGEEIITGQIVDTNAAWLAERLVQMGFVVSRHTAVGDKLTDLVALLEEISKRADFCICSGGLGPTIDDLTAEAVALAFAKPLLLDPIALANIEYYFSRRKRNMVASNQKQALLPEGAIRLDNHAGTAPGFALQHNRCWFVFVPGVPSEMKQMFTEQIKNKLEARFVLHADKLISIKTIGMGEAEIQQKLIDFKLPQHVHLSFRATPEEVQTKLLFPANMAETTITHCTDQVVKSIGDAVFAVDERNQSNTTLIDVINVLIRQRKYSLSLIETFTQGLISAKCIGQDWLLTSSYQQGINANGGKDISQFAKEIAKNYNTDLVLIQLYQGEPRQFHDKNKAVDLYNILITPHQLVKMPFTVVGSIQRKQNQATIRALDFLRITLQTDAFTTTQ